MKVACPNNYEPIGRNNKIGKEEGEKTGSEITITDDPSFAVKMLTL